MKFNEVNFKKKYQNCFFKKVGKIQNKVAEAEKIGCIKKKKFKLLFANKQIFNKDLGNEKVWMGAGWMGGIKAVLRIAYSHYRRVF